MIKTVYVSIGNSDDKLSQVQWSAFILDVNETIDYAARPIHGVWYSSPESLYQNACWCFEIEIDSIAAKVLKINLKELAAMYKQDSIAFAVADTEFLTSQ